MSKQQLFTDIVGFLQERIDKKEVAGDEQESLEIAIDCIRETFKVSDSSKPRDLLEIYEKGISGSSSTPEAPIPQDSAVSDEDKAKANELKSKGNGLMGKHDFKGAADAYTEAIALDSTNAIFFANRAAAFAHLGLHSRSAEDARKATDIDPMYSKAWTRLGVALWAQGDIEGSLKAYESGLKAEGDNPTEAMKRDYANVKKRYDEEVAKKNKTSDSDLDSAIDKVNADRSVGADSGAGAGASSGAGAGAGGAGGSFDFSQIASFMQNPQIQKMAQNLMSDPSALGNLMNSPMAQQMKQKMANGGGMPSMDEINDIMNNLNK